MKSCSKCKQSKAESEFYSTKKKSKDGLRYWCKDCDKDTAAVWAKKNRKRVTANAYRAMIKRKFNFDSDIMPDRCEVCSEDGLIHSDNRRGIFVDHCHETGKVRGFLCHSCNTVLGQARESIPRLEGLIKYLREEKKR